LFRTDYELPPFFGPATAPLLRPPSGPLPASATSCFRHATASPLRPVHVHAP
jgi:hypothetical protein